MKVVQYFKHTRNLNAYIKKYKREHTGINVYIYLMCSLCINNSCWG